MPQIPAALKGANDQIPLFSSILVGQNKLELRNESTEAEVVGTIEFRTSPTNHVWFSGFASREKPPMSLLAIMETNYKASIDGLTIGILGIRSFNEQTLSVEGEIFGEVVYGDKSVDVSIVRFRIPNMVEIPGDPIEYSDRSFSLGRHVFDDGKFTVTMDQVHEFRRGMQEWQMRGGLFLNYACELRKKTGAAISRTEATAFIEKFDLFLSFLNGRKTVSLLLQGMDNDNDHPIWSDYTRYSFYQGPNAHTHSWAQSTFRMRLGSLWKIFSGFFHEPTNTSFIKLAVLWYTDSNTNQTEETSIIVAQTAMELIYNWLVIEKIKLLSGDDAKNITASNKLRLVANSIQFRVDRGAMPILGKMIEDQGQQKDIFEMMVEVRNALVHSQKVKRDSLEKMPNGALRETKRIFLYMVELSLLNIFGYKFRFSSRLIAPQMRMLIGMPVPWHQYYDRIMNNITGNSPDNELGNLEDSIPD